MTLCSWLRGQLKLQKTPNDVPPVPSNHHVQEILVEIGDKENDFIGSKQWIGSVEVRKFVYKYCKENSQMFVCCHIFFNT